MITTKSKFFIVLIFLSYANYSCVQPNDSPKELNTQTQTPSKILKKKYIEKDYSDTDFFLISTLLTSHIQLLDMYKKNIKDPDAIFIINIICITTGLCVIIINKDGIIYFSKELYQYANQAIKKQLSKIKPNTQKLP